MWITKIILIIVFICSIKCQNITENIETVMASTTGPKKGPKLNMKQNIMLNQIIAAYALDGIENELCKNHTIKYKEAIRLFEPWALKMLDASSKLQPGILTGNTGEFGSYDQCVNTHTLTEYGEISGQMCAVDLIPGPKLSRAILKMRNLPDDRFEQILSTIKFNSVWMICIPSSCPYTDVQNHLNRTIQNIIKGLDVDVTIAEDACVSKISSKPLNNFQWTTLIFLCGLVVFVILCTIYEITTKKLLLKPNQVLLSFSAYSNSKFLFSSHSTEQELDCLNGIRSLSILWVILGHRYFLTMYVPIINGLDILDWMQTMPSTIIVGGTVSVDTFFMMSGCLLCYLYFSQMKNGAKFNLILFYLRRYIRVSGPLAIVVLFYVTLLEYMGAGPIWTKTVHGLKDQCVEYWWSTLLHIQNYINPSELCIIQTWYLSCDMQFYFFSPLVLYPSLKWPHFGIFLYFIWTITAIITSFKVAWDFEFNGGMPVTNDLVITKYFMYHYVTSHTRSAAYLIGIGFGYILFLMKDKKIKFNPALRTLGWITSLSIISAVVFGCIPFQRLDHDYNRIESSIYLALSRPSWTIALAWIIFNCVHGMADPINNFLSSHIFKVIAKLSYCMFLTHIGIQFARNGAAKVPYHFSNFDMVYMFFGDLGITLIFSVLLTLTVELPLTKLDNLLRKKMTLQRKVGQR